MYYGSIELDFFISQFFLPKLPNSPETPLASKFLHNSWLSPFCRTDLSFVIDAIFVKLIWSDRDNANDALCFARKKGDTVTVRYVDVRTVFTCSSLRARSVKMRGRIVPHCVAYRDKTAKLRDLSGLTFREQCSVRVLNFCQLFLRTAD